MTNSSGSYLQVATTPINANNQSVSGIDFQTDYRTEFLAGAIDLHAVGNYMDQQTQTAQGITTDYAGAIGSDSSPRGIPKFRATVSATYVQGPWQVVMPEPVPSSPSLGLMPASSTMPGAPWMSTTTRSRRTDIWTCVRPISGTTTCISMATFDVINTPPSGRDHQCAQRHDQSIRDLSML